MYCEDCFEVLFGKTAFADTELLEKWRCFFCSKRQASKHLQKREDWEERWNNLVTCLQNGVEEHPSKKETIFPILPIDQRRPIRVLSLFDGIATGMVALKKMGFVIGKFVASEIDEVFYSLLFINRCDSNRSK